MIMGILVLNQKNIINREICLNPTKKILNPGKTTDTQSWQTTEQSTPQIEKKPKQKKQVFRKSREPDCTFPEFSGKLVALLYWYLCFSRIVFISMSRMFFWLSRIGSAVLPRCFCWLFQDFLLVFTVYAVFIV